MRITVRAHGKRALKMSDLSDESDEERAIKTGEDESDHEFSDPEDFVDDIPDEGEMEVAH